MMRAKCKVCGRKATTQGYCVEHWVARQPDSTTAATLLDVLREPDKGVVRVVPADSFVETLAANVDNDKLDDAVFRQFVRNTLPIVIVRRKKKEE